METESKYRSLVGCLLWVASTTRPDIAYAVSILSRYLSCAGKEHYKTAIGVLQYLMWTKAYKLKMGCQADRSFANSIPDGVNAAELLTFTDASFGDERPMGGFLISYEGSPIHWVSKRLTCTPLSSTESEYLAATSATVAMIHMQDILEFVGPDVKPRGPTALMCDNKAATQISQNEIGTKTMKHIVRRVAWLREVIASGKMRMLFLSGEEQIADIFTKPLAATRFHKLRRCFMSE